MGVIYGQSKANGTEEQEDDLADIDLDDWLYFPPEEKSIDISKNIRDMVHLEITINGLCDPMCKGLCLKCGQNLNTSSCKCSQQNSKPKSYGPLGGLKEKMKQYGARSFLRIYICLFVLLTFMWNPLVRV